MTTAPSRLPGLDALELTAHRRVENPKPDAPLFHLADGIVLAIGPKHSRLLDLPADDYLKVDFRYIETLEHLGRGTTLEGYEDVLPELLRAGVIAPGPAVPDSYLAATLRKLDGFYLGAFEEGLSGAQRLAYENVVAVHARRKRFFEQVGQCPVLPETALRRALHIGDANEVGVQKILCLGDDDLVSVALATLGHDVTVYDIDDYLLSFLRISAKELGLPMEIQESDLRDPLRATQREKFDIVVTDPMSNRDCFELFFSRAIAMMKDDGICYTACFPPTTELFQTVVGELGFEIEAWFARHNRYYSHFIKQHTYESDWVKLRKTAATKPKVPADEFCVPLNLYREDFYQRVPIFVAQIDELDNGKFTRPMYLDLLLDCLEHETKIHFHQRRFFNTEDWSQAIALAPEGHLVITAHRETRELSLTLFPYANELEAVLRRYLMNIYKPTVSDASVDTNASVWTLRLR